MPLSPRRVERKKEKLTQPSVRKHTETQRSVAKHGVRTENGLERRGHQQSSWNVERPGREKLICQDRGKHVLGGGGFFTKGNFETVTPLKFLKASEVPAIFSKYMRLSTGCLGMVMILFFKI